VSTTTEKNLTLFEDTIESPERTAMVVPGTPYGKSQLKERIVRKSIIVVFSVLISVGFVHPIVAKNKKPKTDSVVCDKKFEILSKRGKSKVGTYSTKTVTSKDKKQIAISETITLSRRGKTLGLKSTVIYTNNDSLAPLKGNAETTIDKKICMTGTVKFSRTGKTVDYECSGHMNGKTGDAINPPKKYTKKDLPVAAGTIVFQSAIPSIGPRILPAEGELKNIVLVEFPDDVEAPELIIFKKGYRLVRGKCDNNGQYDIQLFRPHSKDSLATYRFDKNNQVVSMDLFGKFSLHEAPKTGKTIEVTLTPTKPYLLPDQSTKILVEKKTQYENRKRFGSSQLKKGDLTLDIVPNTVIASGGYLFYLTTPHEYKFGHIRKSDMIITVVDSCKSSVLIKKGRAPLVQLKKLKGNLNFNCDNRRVSQLKSLSGKGKHFVSLRVGRTEIYRRHPSKVLGTGMDVFVVNNFGAKKIRLEYMQKKVVTIGPETITIESFNFQYKTKSVEIKISTESKVSKAEAVIVEYSDLNRQQ
jgi:hypothetical protein